MKKVRIIGGGLTGCVLAYLLKKKFKVFVLEKEDHLGGLCWTDVKEGMIYNPYGLHVFHTKKKWVWDFINQFLPMRRIVYRTKTNIWGQVVDYPINRNTIENLREGDKIKTELARLPDKLDEKNLETCLISMVGPTLYDLVFKGYNQKMWGREPKELTADWAPTRIEIRKDNDDRYFRGEYQGYPHTGYNSLFDKLTDGCEVIRGLEAVDSEKGDIVTIPADIYFKERYGALEWRGLKVRTKVVSVPYYQEVPLIYQPTLQYKWVKVSENKHLTGQFGPKTLICMEIPSTSGRFYPVYTPESLKRYKRYRKFAKNRGITLCGRLGGFKYLNMDSCIVQAHKIANRLLREVA